jgi:hypothetical protein
MTAQPQQHKGMAQPTAHAQFKDRLYLERLGSIHDAFPALKPFLEKLLNEEEPGRKAVREHYQTMHGRVPGRCYCLNFHDSSVSVVDEAETKSPTALRNYLKTHPAAESRANNHRRLFILEDMEPDYVDALGHHLGVDPLVFSEQMNTWNFTDSWSIPHRGLPSMSVPGQSFTLRYYELRTLFDPESINVLSWQMSFAVNRRRYERWRDIDVPSAGKPDRRHAFVRRSASFWTSQDPTQNGGAGMGWDGQSHLHSRVVRPLLMQLFSPAVILVDPPFAIGCRTPPTKPGTVPLTPKREYHACTPNGIVLDEAANKSMEEGPILKAPDDYRTRSILWQAQSWGTPQLLDETCHESWPYHGGCSTLAPLTFSLVGIGAPDSNIQIFKEKRNPSSAMDEMVFFWTKLATPKLIADTNEKPSNATHYLLKHIAQHWVHQLELMNTTIAKAEWFSDDYQAKIDDSLSRQKWKADLIKTSEIAKDINYMRRHLNHFWRAMYLNLERMGVQLGSEEVDKDASISLAIKGAQKDFLTIHTRMQPLRDRAEALTTVSNDLANLRAAFRGVHDGEIGLRLSVLASIVFPFTLVATIFSMNEDYLPGKGDFWKLWSIGPPFCVTVAMGVFYGPRPWRLFLDIWEYMVFRYRAWKDARAQEKQTRESEGKTRFLSRYGRSVGLADGVEQKGGAKMKDGADMKGRAEKKGAAEKKGWGEGIV